MESQQIKITLKKAASVHITLYPTTNSDSPIILLLPAMGVKAAYYQPLVKQLNEKGFPTITADLRGLGLSSVRPSKKK